MRHGNGLAVSANAAEVHTDTLMAGATRHCLLQTEAKTAHGVLGKLTTRQRLSLAAAMHCLTARFFVSIVIKEPVVTVVD